MLELVSGLDPARERLQSRFGRFAFLSKRQQFLDPICVTFLAYDEGELKAGDLDSAGG